ncbi:MAG: PKD domain-containing protein [Thermoplasmata archaeon]
MKRRYLCSTCLVLIIVLGSIGFFIGSSGTVQGEIRENEILWRFGNLVGSFGNSLLLSTTSYETPISYEGSQGAVVLKMGINATSYSVQYPGGGVAFRLEIGAAYSDLYWTSPCTKGANAISSIWFTIEPMNDATKQYSCIVWQKEWSNRMGYNVSTPYSSTVPSTTDAMNATVVVFNLVNDCYTYTPAGGLLKYICERLKYAPQYAQSEVPTDFGLWGDGASFKWCCDKFSSTTEIAKDAFAFNGVHWRFPSTVPTTGSTYFRIKIKAHAQFIYFYGGNFNFKGYREFETAPLYITLYCGSQLPPPPSEGGGGGGGGGGCTWIDEQNNILPQSDMVPRTTLNVRDWYKYDGIPGDYITLQEKDRTITYLDTVKKITVVHPENVDVLVDQNGRFHTYSQPIPPISALTDTGENYTTQLSAKDGDAFYGTPGSSQILNFTNLANAPDLKLITRSSLYTPSQPPPPHITAGGSKMSIAVETLTPEGWKQVGIIPFRWNWYENIVDLSGLLPDAQGDYKIKLVWTGYDALDFVGIDTTEDVPVLIDESPPIVAFAPQEVTSALLNSDSNYVKLRFMDSLILVFQPSNNDVEPGMKKDYFFYFEGYTQTALIDIYQQLNFTLEIMGRKGNSVSVFLMEDNLLNATGKITREAGNPQTLTLPLYAHSFSFSKAILYYSAVHNGANPVKLRIEHEGKEQSINLNFNTNEGMSQIKEIDLTQKIAELTEDSRTRTFDASHVALYFELPPDAEFIWNFGDGHSGNGVTVNHTYASSGIYPISLYISTSESTWLFCEAIICV